MSPTEDHLKVVRSVCQIFQEMTGAVLDERREAELLLPWVQSGWMTYDFRLVIEHHLIDPFERKYLETPGRMNLRSIFNPARRDRVLDLHSDLKRSKEIKKKVAQNSQSPDVRINSIRLACCGGVFDQRFMKTPDASVQPSKGADGKISEGGFRWKETSREGFEKHFDDCLKMKRAALAPTT